MDRSLLGFCLYYVSALVASRELNKLADHTDFERVPIQLDRCGARSYTSDHADAQHFTRHPWSV